MAQVTSKVGPSLGLCSVAMSRDVPRCMGANVGKLTVCTIYIQGAQCLVSILG